MRKILASFDKVDSGIVDLIVHANNWMTHLQVLEEIIPASSTS